MSYPGKLAIGLLQEDNPVKFFFRFSPAFTVENGAFTHTENTVKDFPEDGYIRIVPDKYEISHFKNRMLRLGRFCAMDLQKYPNENEKIRINKNYREGGPEHNSFIVYSDVICMVPSSVAMEVLDPVAVFPGEEMTLRVPTPGTSLVLTRRDGKLSGPWMWTFNGEVAGCITLKHATNIPFAEKSLDETAEKLYTMQNAEGQTITLFGEPALFGVAADYVDVPAKPLPEIPQAKPVPRPMPTDVPAPVKAEEKPVVAEKVEIKPEVEPEIKSEAPAPEKTQESEKPAPAAVEAKPEPEPAAAPAVVVEEKAPVAVTPEVAPKVAPVVAPEKAVEPAEKKPEVPEAIKVGVGIVKAAITKVANVAPAAKPVVVVTAQTTTVAPQEAPRTEAPWLQRTEPAKPRAISTRLTLREQVSQAQGSLNSRRGRSLHEIVDEQWRKSRIDQLGHPITTETTGKPVASPIERALYAVEQAWGLSEARTGLLSGLLNIQALKEAVSECLGIQPEKGQTCENDALLTQLESDKLKAMGELDALRQKRTQLTNELLEQLRQAHKQEFDKYEARNKALLAEIKKNEAAAKEAQASAEAARTELTRAEKDLEEKLTSSAMAERAMRLIRDGAAMVKETDPAGHPELYDPTAGQLISDLRVQMENAGFAFSNDDMINLLLSAHVGGLLVFSGAPGSGKSELARRFAAALGLTGKQKRFVEMRTPADTELDDLIAHSDGLTPIMALYDDANLDMDEKLMNGLLRKWERARQNGIPLCLILTVQDLPEGAPLGARLLSRAFFLRFERAPYDAQWKPKNLSLPTPEKAVSLMAMENILKPAKELRSDIEVRLETLRAGLNKLGWTLDRRTLDQLWLYCASASELMAEKGLPVLDLALSQRALPEMLAAMDVDALHELPNLFCDMPRCLRLMDQPLPLPPL